MAFPSGNILNHLQNKKQVKKNTKQILSHQCGLFVCFVLFCFVLFCFVRSRWLNLRMYYHIKITIFHHPFVESLPPLEICFLKPNRCHPVSALLFAALFSLMKSFGSNGAVAFNHFTWRSWGQMRRYGQLMAGSGIRCSTHQVEGNGSEHPYLLFSGFFLPFQVVLWDFWNINSINVYPVNLQGFIDTSKRWLATWDFWTINIYVWWPDG